MRYAQLVSVLGLMLACTLFGVSCKAADDAAATDRRAQFMKQREEQMKTSLGVNDEEWKALQPKIDAVNKARRESFAGGGGFGGGRRGGAGGGGNAPVQDEATKTDLQKKNDALKVLADNKDADPKALQVALKDVREAREKAKENLKKAQGELKELLTARQEAQLVLQGMLE